MTQKEEKKVCGIVMPISALDGCNEGHWSDVLEIITEAIEQGGFEGNLVSNADDVGIIQKRIIQNLYENPIVVCDVSGKNPNVMFELGMRLAFDKPTIIIKDDKTAYSFDTSPIEHLEYPRDLRFSKIVDFKIKLVEKIKATFEKSTTDKSYTTFLKHFGEFKVAKIDQKEVSGQEYIIEELRNIRIGMRRLERNVPVRRIYQRDETGRIYRQDNSEFQFTDEDSDYCLGSSSEEEIKNILDVLSVHPEVTSLRIKEFEPDHCHLQVKLKDVKAKDELQMIIQQTLPRIKHDRHASHSARPKRSVNS